MIYTMYMYIGDEVVVCLLFCSVHVVNPRCVIHVYLDVKSEEGENGWWEGGGGEGECVPARDSIGGSRPETRPLRSTPVPDMTLKGI